MELPQSSKSTTASQWRIDNYDGRPLQLHQKDMIIACESGDISVLQQLFKAYNIEPGNPPIYRFAPESGAPATWRMITAAVAARHPLIVAYLLSTYPKVNIWYSVIVKAAMENPDIETLRVLYSHDPSLVNFEWDPLRNFLTEACRSSDDWLIDFLLDNGADPNLGGHGGALDSALNFSRSLDLIKKMIHKGAYVSNLTVHEAIRHQRADVLAYLVGNVEFVSKIGHVLDGSQSRQNLLDFLYEKDNEGAIGLVKEYFSTWKQRAKGQEAKKEEEKESTAEKERVMGKARWQFWKPRNNSKMADCRSSECDSTVDLLQEKH